MSNDPYVKEWNTATGSAFAIAILIGLFVGYKTEMINAAFTMLVISGLYLAVSFYLKSRKDDSGGPSEFGAAVMGGVLLCGLGVCGFIFKLTGDVIVTVICILAVVMASSVAMIMSYRKYL